MTGSTIEERAAFFFDEKKSGGANLVGFNSLSYRKIDLTMSDIDQNDSP